MGELQSRHDLITRNRRKFRSTLSPLYLTVENAPSIKIDPIGLMVGPTLEDGLSAFKSIREKLKELCNEPCCKCKKDPKTGKPIPGTWTPCSPEDCKKDVDAFMDAIEKTWRKFHGENTRRHPDRVRYGDKEDDTSGRYWCYEWAAAFRDCVNKYGKKCWNAKRRWIKQNQPGQKIHAYAEVYACQDETADNRKTCTRMLDDGYKIGDNDEQFFHVPPWPTNIDGWGDATESLERTYSQPGYAQGDPPIVCQ